MTETLEQIALRIWNEEYPYSKTPEFPIEFAKRLVEALGAQKPVAEINDNRPSSIYWLAGERNCANGTKLYAAPKLGEVK